MLGEVRAPRLLVQVDGVEMPGALSAEVHSNDHYAADRFRIRFAASPVILSALSTPGVRIVVQIGWDFTWTDLITGVPDTVTFDPIANLVDVEGRDLSALLIESQLEENFSNSTASEIAQILASRHGLGALVTPTTSPVGRLYQSDRDSVSLGQFARTSTEWDLLAYLAHREGFDLYVTGETLTFAAAALQSLATLASSDCVHLTLEQSVNLSRPIIVNVKSWNSKTSDAVVSTASVGGLGQPWSRTLVRPNLSADEAQLLAERTVADSKRHQWTANVVMPGETSLSPRSQLTLTSTGTAWDRTYWISALSRHIDFNRGFTQHLTLVGVQ